MKNNLRIRKLTPKECFRLMGVRDEDSDRLEHLSNATKYHLAGDSIVINTLQAIFKSILIDHPVVDQKPIHLIEFFAGYGSQSLSLKYLNIPFEHWRICEWAIHSIDAYKSIHFPNDNEDYSDLYDKEDLVEYLYNKGISSNWNEPIQCRYYDRYTRFYTSIICNDLFKKLYGYKNRYRRVVWQKNHNKRCRGDWQK